MIANGVNDETFPEFVRTLCFPDGTTIEDINTYNKKMISELTSLDNQTDLVIMNANWLSNKCQLVEGFSEIAEEYYNAPVRIVSLDGLYSDQQHPVNQWFSQNLGKPYMLSDRIDVPFSVSPNIMKFKGSWAEKFNVKNTANREFTNYSGTVTSVPTMSNTFASKFEHYFSNDCDVLQLHYGNSSYSLKIFLPENDITEFISSFNSEYYSNLTHDRSSMEANVKLPKFSLQWEGNLDNQLRAMGLDKVLKLNPGTFSKFYTAPDNENELMKHSTCVAFNVDEEGAEIKTVSTSQTGDVLSPGPARSVDFNVNRPFFFMVVENSTNTIIAAGAVYEL